MAQAVDNMKVVRDMVDGWKNQDEDAFCNPHAENFTFNFIPNNIPALQAYTGNCIVGREGLRKWNRRTWGPGNPMLPLSKLASGDWASAGDKVTSSSKRGFSLVEVYANGKMTISFFGTEPEEIHFYFCWTVQNGKITYAAVNGDIATTKIDESNSGIYKR